MRPSALPRKDRETLVSGFIRSTLKAKVGLPAGGIRLELRRVGRHAHLARREAVAVREREQVGQHLMQAARDAGHDGVVSRLAPE